MAGPTGEQDWYVSGVFNMSFLNLNDTFGDYIDRAGKIPKVNSDEDGLVPSDLQIDNVFEYGGAVDLSSRYSSLQAAIEAQDGKAVRLLVLDSDTVSSLASGDYTGLTVQVQPGLTVTSSVSPLDFNIMVHDGGQWLFDVDTIVNAYLESKGNISGVVAFDAVDGDETLTYEGNKAPAELWQCFGSGLTIDWQTGISAYLDWFGLVKDGTDCYSHLQSILNTIDTGNSTSPRKVIANSMGLYGIGAHVYIPEGVILDWNNAEIRPTANASMFYLFGIGPRMWNFNIDVRSLVIGFDFTCRAVTLAEKEGIIGADNIENILLIGDTASTPPPAGQTAIRVGNTTTSPTYFKRGNNITIYGFEKQIHNYDDTGNCNGNRFTNLLLDHGLYPIYEENGGGNLYRGERQTDQGTESGYIQLSGGSYLDLLNWDGTYQEIHFKGDSNFVTGRIREVDVEKDEGRYNKVITALLHYEDGYSWIKGTPFDHQDGGQGVMNGVYEFKDECIGATYKSNWYSSGGGSVGGTSFISADGRPIVAQAIYVDADSEMKLDLGGMAPFLAENRLTGWFEFLLNKASSQEYEIGFEEEGNQTGNSIYFSGGKDSNGDNLDLCTILIAGGASYSATWSQPSGDIRAFHIFTDGNIVDFYITVDAEGGAAQQTLGDMIFLGSMDTNIPTGVLLQPFIKVIRTSVGSSGDSHLLYVLARAKRNIA